MITHSYSFNQIVATFDSRELEDFFEETDCIKLMFKNDFRTAQVAANGNVTLNEMNDKTVDIELKLHMNSPSNAILLEHLNEQTERGIKISEFVIKDVLGNRTVFVGHDCCVATAPEIIYGQEATARMWKLLACHGELK